MKRRPLKGLVLAATLSVVLSGCDSIQEALGLTPEEPPLPGERISVLLNQRSISPDPEASRTQILLPAPESAANWPQAGGFANHAMHHLALPEQIGKAWSTNVGDGRDDAERLMASPIVAKGVVYTIDAESVLTATSTVDGDKLWDVELEPEDEDDVHNSGGIAYENGVIYAATGYAELIALDAETGKILWRISVGGPVRTAPTVRGGRVFVVTVDNRTIAVNALNGERLWGHDGITESASLLGGASPAVADGIVIVAYSSGELVALKADNGRVLWADSLAAVRRTDIISALSHIRGRPIIDRGRVIAVSHSGLMAAYDLRGGQRLWDLEVGGTESPWVAGDYVYMLSNENELIAVNRTSGKVHWVRPLPLFEDPEDQDDPIIWTGPLLAGDRLIVAGNHGQALAVSPYSGRLIGSVELPDGISVPPVIAQDTLYFLSDDADLVAYR